MARPDLLAALQAMEQRQQPEAIPAKGVNSRHARALASLLDRESDRFRDGTAERLSPPSEAIPLLP